MARWVQFQSLGIVAIIDDADGGGKLTDPGAPCNRPAIDPANWLDHVHFHSGMDYFEMAMAVQTVGVTHTALATASSSTSNTAPILTLLGQFRTTDITLVTHNLGYVPRYMVAYQGARLPAGLRIQSASGGGRVVQHFATTSVIGLREFAYSGTADLPAMAATYEVLVMQSPAGDGPHLFARAGASGAISIGRGKIRSDARYLRALLAGETSFDFNLGPTMSAGNGGVRVTTGGVITDENGYSGGFIGPDYLPIGGVF